MIRVEAVYALAEYQYQERLELAEGARVRDALEALADRAGFAELDLESVPLGIFGEPVSRERVLADGDRLEIYRALRIDPMAARRRRADRQAG